MRISDWSSDVCSSDLTAKPCPRGHTPQWMGLGGGKYLMAVPAKRVADLKVDVRFDARAVALLVDAGNRVVGLVVRRDDPAPFVRTLQGGIPGAGSFLMHETRVQQPSPQPYRHTPPLGPREH